MTFDEVRAELGGVALTSTDGDLEQALLDEGLEVLI